MQKRNQNHAPILEATGRKLSKATVARLLSSTSILAAKGLVAAALLAFPVQLDLSGGDQIVTLGKAHAESGSGSGGSGSGGGDNSGSGSGSGGGDNSGSGSGGSGGGGDNSGSGSGGDGGDNSGPGSGGGNDNDNDNDGDNSGPGSGGDNDNDGDNSGPGRGGDNNDGDRDGNDDRDDRDDDAPDGNGNNNAARPEIVVNLSQSDLTAVLNGSKILVDNLGRVLEVQIELEHGGTTVIAKPHGGDAQRNPGPIDSFTIVTR